MDGTPAKNDDKMAPFSMGTQRCQLAPAAPSVAKLAAPFNIARFLAGKLAVFIHETAKSFIAISSLFLGLILKSIKNFEFRDKFNYLGIS